MKVFTALLVLCAAVLYVSSSPVVKNRRQEQVGIDEDGKFLLGWTVAEDSITFNITVEATGYIGLGFSADGTMANADLFIGGVNPDGSQYSGDYHSARNGAPTLDEVQNFVLEEFSETATHTNLVVSRPIVAAEANDNDITTGLNFVIYSYGLNDTISYHGQETRGSKQIDLLA